MRQKPKILQLSAIFFNSFSDLAQKMLVKEANVFIPSTDLPIYLFLILLPSLFSGRPVQGRPETSPTNTRSGGHANDRDLKSRPGP